MEEVDRKILNIIQADFPLTERPFLSIGKRLNISEDEAFERVKRLKYNGVIRRIGANFDSRKLGYVSTLCAATVPEDKIEEFVELVNSYPNVTHNYRRDHKYNIWFTFIDESMDRIESVLKEIYKKTGIYVFNLPAKRIFKIRVSFDLTTDY
jgi:DNA-binding Lrp family transcriptional regulator